MSIIIWPVFLLLLLSLQSSWFFLFPGNNFTPDFLLLFVVFQAMAGGTSKGVFCGTVVGVLQDTLSPTTFGFHTVTRALIGLFTGKAKERVFKDNVQCYLAFVGVASLFVKITHFLLLLIIARFSYGWFIDYIGHTTSYLVLNLIVSLPMWVFLKKISTWLEKQSNC